MVNEYEIKKQICEIGKRIYDRGMVAANDGNISVKINDNEFLCTPTGVSKGFMTPDYICRVDKEGKVLFCGRLGQYCYYDMDKVILSALNIADEVL